MDLNELNHNDDLDIVMIKLELTISEKEQVEWLIDDANELSIESFERRLKEIVTENQSKQIIEWMKNNKY